MFFSCIIYYLLQSKNVKKLNLRDINKHSRKTGEKHNLINDTGNYARQLQKAGRKNSIAAKK